VRSAKSRILLASLEPATRTKWSDQLARSGYEVVKADDLDRATALAGERPIDLAIVELPQAGPSPAAWITGLIPVSPGMKILVIASHADTDSLRAADSLGANGFVERSATPSAVLQRIRELVRRHPMVYDAGPPWPLPPEPH
jgi:DNA-binding response OmpR family regulator